MEPTARPGGGPGEELLAALVEHTSNVVAVGDAGGRLVYVSPSIEAMLHLRPEELVGTDGLDMVHPDDRARIVAAFEAGSDATEIRVEVRLRARCGEWRHCECAFTDAFHDPRIRGIVVSMRDVTERARAEHALAERESHWRSLVANARDIVTVIDPEGRFTYISPAVERLLGWKADELIGISARDALHPDDSADALAGLDEQSSSSGPLAPIEYRVLATDGSWRYLEGFATDLRDDPAVGGLVVNARDVTDRKRAEALLAGQSTVLELIARGESLEATLEVLAQMVGAHAPGARGAIVVGSEADSPPRLVVAPDLSPAETEVLDAKAGWSQPIVVAHSGLVLGRVALVLDERRFPDAEERRVAELAANLGAIAIGRAAAVERLAHQARHDHLTGLPNRHLFLERLSDALARRDRDAETVAVLFLDLDRFKDLNDSLGHQVGDRVLAVLAHRLEASLRSGDIVARFGGDEFVFICRVEGPPHAQLVAERILGCVREPYTLDDGEAVLTGSVGIALAPRRDETGDDTDPAEVAQAMLGEAAGSLLRDADVAMYRAKERGRARIEVFDDTLRTDLLARLETEHALRLALERREFELAYQPLVALDDGQLVGMEALVRWQRPGVGLVLPGAFIPTAEAIGLIAPIGEWVLREACRQFSEWRAEHGAADRLTLSVNVSSRQLVHPEIVDVVRTVLADAALPPEALCLEVTESVFLDDLAGVLLVLDELHALGLLIWLDDFGTGYSCLEYLKRLPVDGVKLDRAFVSGLARGGPDEAILRACVDMAHALGMVAVGEGVETPEQRDGLARLACDYGQGFLFSAPQSAGAFEARFLRSARSETA